MLRLFWKSIQDFRTIYKKLLLFEYLFALLTSFAIIPILTFILNRIIRIVGTGSVLNGEVYQIGLSYTGVLGLISICLVAVIVLFIEFGVITVICQQHYFRKEVSIADAVWTTLRQTPKLLGFGLIELLFFLLFLVPFLDSPLSSWFYAFFNAPIFVNTRILDTSSLRLLVYALLFVAAIYMFLRSIFVLHFIMLEDQPIRRAVRSSFALTKGRRLRLFVYLLLLNAGLFGAGFGIINTLSHMPSWLNINVLKAISDHHSLTLSAVLTYMFTLLLVPINIIVLTRAFYRFSVKPGKRPENKLQLRSSGWIGRMEGKLFSFLERKTRKRIVFPAALILYLSIALLVSYVANDNLIYVKWNVIVSAHRGYIEAAPENSLPSVRDAIAKGIDSVEIDVQLTSDGEVVLHHDYTLKRMAGVSRRVSDMTYDELTKLDIGVVAGEQEGDFVPVGIPLLSEVLAEAQGKIKLLIDLKPYGPAEELAEQVVKLVEQFEMTDAVYIQSFDQATLKQIRMLNPDIRLGQILYFALGDLSTLDVDFYTIEQVLLTDRLVERAHRNNREVWVWTVNSERNLKEVLKFDVDGIITDFPTRAQSMVELK
jgi:glycerophosphoryl diester phosphodiesterase